MNPEITRIIDQYLNGELSLEDKQLFEDRLAKNPELQAEVQLQRDVVEGIKRSTQRLEIKKTKRSYHRSNVVKWSIISLSSLAIVGLAVYFIFFADNIEPISDELKEKLNKYAQFDQVDVQYFQIPEEGGVVMTAEGVLLSVPKDAFLKDGKPYSGETIIQFQEAMDPQDIVMSGLSTTSGDRLLETQGMFSLRSFTKNGEELAVNPKVGVYVQAPVEGYKPGMQLFSGKKDQNGNIDWQNPEPLVKIPVSADMSELDFYPVAYEPYLDEQKWNKSKKSRDSLYLSFEDYYESGYSSESNNYFNGQTLFELNCATCHQLDRESTGPALRNARALWNKHAESPDLLYTWIRDWEEAARISEWANQRKNLRPTIQTKMNLSNDEIDLIFDFIGGAPANIDDEIQRNLEMYFDSWDDESNQVDMASAATTADPVGGDAVNCILPSKVLGFWNPKFNNTNLATRDFEKRMREIHSTCNNAVLDKYVSQLNKPLSQIDKEVVAMGYPSFEAFAAENVGKIDPKNPHLEQLQEFYNNAVAQLKSRSKENQTNEKQRQKDWDEQMKISREKEKERSVYRETQALQEEYQFNLNNVKKQINASVGFTIKYGDGTVYNIDKYVMDASVARESMDRIDPVSGKRVKVTYNEFSFNVPNASTYIKLYAYIFPHELNSFQRISGENGTFSYPLNDDILYDMGVVGITENGYEYFQKKSFKKGELGKIQMTKVSEERLKASIAQLNTTRNSKAIKINSEFEWLVQERKDFKEQKLRKKMAIFREELVGLIFPCMMERCAN